MTFKLISDTNNGDINIPDILDRITADGELSGSYLREGLFKTAGFRKIEYRKQGDVGIMYHFISPRLQPRA